MKKSASVRSVATAGVALALVLTGCRSYDGPVEDAAAVRPTTTTSSTLALPATTTTVATTVPTTVAPIPAATPTPPPGLGKGSTGPQVLALEQRLAELRYDVHKVDGNFDAATHHAVMAFQKAQNLPRTGRATDDVLAALPTATMPTAMTPDGGADRVEIDLKRQVLTLWQGGQLVRTLSISTGTGRKYCVDGQCAKAVTPGGSYKVLRKIKGLRVSRLGQLYNPLYFNGGIAIHGSNSVPAGPASHGCVRIPMVASLWFHETVPLGTPVYVHGGAKAPVPFNEPLPGEDPAATATTTTAPVATTVPTTLPAETTTTTTTIAPVQPTLPLNTTTTTTTTTLAPPP